MTPRRSLVLAAATVLATGMSACASSRSLSASFNDLDANNAISRQLSADDQFGFRDVDLTVFEGRALLTGTVESAAEQRRLVEHALAAEGIVQVIDETFIADRTSAGRGMADARIDAALRTRLLANASIRSSDVKLAVSDGSVYLIGVARDRAALERLIQTARRTRDVRQVVSHIIYLDPNRMDDRRGAL